MTKSRQNMCVGGDGSCWQLGQLGEVSVIKPTHHHSMLFGSNQSTTTRIYISHEGIEGYMKPTFSIEILNTTSIQLSNTRSMLRVSVAFV